MVLSCAPLALRRLPYFFSATPACFFLSWFVADAADSLGAVRDEAPSGGARGRGGASLCAAAAAAALPGRPAAPQRVVSQAGGGVDGNGWDPLRNVTTVGARKLPLLIPCLESLTIGLGDNAGTIWDLGFWDESRSMDASCREQGGESIITKPLKPFFFRLFRLDEIKRKYYLDRM